jgi:hypothetical protein
MSSGTYRRREVPNTLDTHNNIPSAVSEKIECSPTWYMGRGNVTEDTMTVST